MRWLTRIIGIIGALILLLSVAGIFGTVVYFIVSIIDYGVRGNISFLSSIILLTDTFIYFISWCILTIIGYIILIKSSEKLANMEEYD